MGILFFCLVGWMIACALTKRWKNKVRNAEEHSTRLENSEKKSTAGNVSQSNVSNRQLKENANIAEDSHSKPFGIFVQNREYLEIPRRCFLQTESSGSVTANSSDNIKGERVLISGTKVINTVSEHEEKLSKCFSSPSLLPDGKSQHSKKCTVLNRQDGLHLDTPNLLTGCSNVSRLQTEDNGNLSKDEDNHKNLGPAGEFYTNTGIVTYFETHFKTSGVILKTCDAAPSGSEDEQIPPRGMVNATGQVQNSEVLPKCKTWSAFSNLCQNSRKSISGISSETEKYPRVLKANRTLFKKPRDLSADLFNGSSADREQNAYSLVNEVLYNRSDDSMSQKELVNVICTVVSVPSANDKECLHNILNGEDITALGDKSSPPPLCQRCDEIIVDKQKDSFFPPIQNKPDPSVSLSKNDVTTKNALHSRETCSSDPSREIKTTFPLLHGQTTRDQFWKYHTKCCDEHKPCPAAATILKQLQKSENRQSPVEPVPGPPSDEELLQDGNTLPSINTESNNTLYPSLSSKKKCLTLPELRTNHAYLGSEATSQHLHSEALVHHNLEGLPSENTIKNNIQFLDSGAEAKTPQYPISKSTSDITIQGLFSETNILPSLCTEKSSKFQPSLSSNNKCLTLPSLNIDRTGSKTIFKEDCKEVVCIDSTTLDLCSETITSDSLLSETVTEHNIQCLSSEAATESTGQSVRPDFMAENIIESLWPESGVDNCIQGLHSEATNEKNIECFDPKATEGSIVPGLCSEPIRKCQGLNSERNLLHSTSTRNSVKLQPLLSSKIKCQTFPNLNIYQEIPITSFQEQCKLSNEAPKDLYSEAMESENLLSEAVKDSNTQCLSSLGTGKDVCPVVSTWPVVACDSSPQGIFSETMTIPAVNKVCSDLLPDSSTKDLQSNQGLLQGMTGYLDQGLYSQPITNSSRNDLSPETENGSLTTALPSETLTCPSTLRLHPEDFLSQAITDPYNEGFCPGQLSSLILNEELQRQKSGIGKPQISDTNQEENMTVNSDDERFYRRCSEESLLPSLIVKETLKIPSGTVNEFDLDFNRDQTIDNNLKLSKVAFSPSILSLTSMQTDDEILNWNRITDSFKQSIFTDGDITQDQTSFMPSTEIMGDNCEKRVFQECNMEKNLIDSVLDYNLHGHPSSLGEIDELSDILLQQNRKRVDIDFSNEVNKNYLDINSKYPIEHPFSLLDKPSDDIRKIDEQVKHIYQDRYGTSKSKEASKHDHTQNPLTNMKITDSKTNHISKTPVQFHRPNLEALKKQNSCEDTFDSSCVNKDENPEIKSFLLSRLCNRQYHSVFETPVNSLQFESPNNDEELQILSLKVEPTADERDTVFVSRTIAEHRSENCMYLGLSEELKDKMINIREYLMYLYAGSPKIKTFRNFFDGTNEEDLVKNDLGVLSNLHFCKVITSVQNEIPEAVKISNAEVTPDLSPVPPDPVYVPPTRKELHADSELAILNILSSLKKSLDYSANCCEDSTTQ